MLSAQPSLDGYLANDLELQRLALEVAKVGLSTKETAIENGIDVQLSTGAAYIQFNGDVVKTTFKPSATVKVPQASNLTLSASSDVQPGSGENTVKDTALNISADIISGDSINRKITIMTAERNLLLAKRKLQNRALEAEKEYYGQLKTLYNSAVDIISKQKDLYDDTILFEEIKAKGFSKTSAKYRQSEMRVLSDRHEVETKIRELDHDCAVFATKCSVEFVKGTRPYEFLPKEVPSVEAVDILDFPKSDYTKIEEASYALTVAELRRKAQKDFTLSANAGYTFSNSKAKSSANENEDTLNVGASTNLQGLGIGAGVNLPVTGDNHNTIYTFSASIDLNKFRTAGIRNRKNEIEVEQELLSILSAEEDYDTAIVDRKTALDDIRWSKRTNAETFDMYVTLADDMGRYLKAGIITESEYLNAFANKESYRIKLLLDDINLIIYNNETKLLFCRDGEIQD